MTDPNPPPDGGKTRPMIALVIGGILLLITAIAVPGLLILRVQRARISAANAQCSSGLRQLGIAYHNYHDVMGAFPTENGLDESLYYSILDFIEQGHAKQQTTAPIRLYLCPNRRSMTNARGKRDFGYAASSGAGSAGQSVFDTAGGADLTAIKKANGPENTLMLSHLWMDPATYTGGDPTDLGWATKNNSRSINTTAKHDSDPSGSTSHIGGPHPGALPSLFADGSVRPVPYDFANWNLLWAWDNTKPVAAPK